MVASTPPRDPDASAPTNDLVRMPLRDLRVGDILRGNVYADGSPVVLIGAGQRLTRAQFDKIVERGITHVRVGRADFDQVRGTRARIAALREVHEQRERFDASRTRWTSDEPVLTCKPSGPPKRVTRDVVRDYHDQFENSVDDVRTAFAGLASGNIVSRKVIDSLVDDCIDQITGDVDQFLSLGAGLDVNRYPMTHGIQVARIAMATGAVLGMDAEALSQLGAGCLLHDVGMLAIDQRLVNSERPLDRMEMLTITKHPVKTFEMIGAIPGIPLGARMVAYQMHERLDGSGYPRGIGANRIHPFTRIAMLADAYVAMISPRPHRPPLAPYYALVELLDCTARGQFDSEAMLGMLDTLSLFPVGSAVELDDGRVGRVMRANPGTHTRPVVECWERSAPGDTSIVDLANETNVAIARPLLDL